MVRSRPRRRGGARAGHRPRAGARRRAGRAPRRTPGSRRRASRSTSTTTTHRSGSSRPRSSGSGACTCSSTTPPSTGACRSSRWTRETWDWITRIDLRLPYFLSQAAARRMIEQAEGGSIVSISSLNALYALEQISVYGPAKAGLSQLTKVMALEWAEHGIRANAIAPGFMDTPLAAPDLGRRGHEPLDPEPRPAGAARASARARRAPASCSHRTRARSSTGRRCTSTAARARAAAGSTRIGRPVGSHSTRPRKQRRLR